MLEAVGIRKAFGGVIALQNVNLRVPMSQVTGLIGPNGAGKTTALNVISGFVRADAGRVMWNGKDITGLPPHLTARLGVARTFQGAMAFPELSVQDNLRIAVRARGGTEDYQRSVQELAATCGLTDLTQVEARHLSFGLLRRLGIAMALASAPQVLLLDEPGAGLSPAEKSDLCELVSSFRRQGMGVLLVEHDMNLVMSLCDYLFVMHAGGTVASGTAAEVRTNAMVQEVYLGATGVNG